MEGHRCCDVSFLFEKLLRLTLFWKLRIIIMNKMDYCGKEKVWQVKNTNNTETPVSQC